MKKTINDRFENEFLSIKLETQIEHCNHSELVPMFKAYLKNHQPILEAGCGSGKWVWWFLKQGWNSMGLDWSEKLCKRATKELSSRNFVCGDLQQMPFRNAEFGSIVALGSIEHTIAGPKKILEEFHRILKNDGVAIITIPYAGLVRRCVHLLFEPFNRLKSISWVRRCFNKKGHEEALKKEAVQKWHPRFTYGNEGVSFFEYQFNKKQMRFFFNQAGFQIIKEYVALKEAGIYHSFRGPFRWSFVGNFDKQSTQFKFNWFGNLLQKTLPVCWVGHMLYYVVKHQNTEI